MTYRNNDDATRTTIINQQQQTANTINAAAAIRGGGGANSAVIHGGRFDFDDGGTYCGGWEDGKAHGFGVCTGPKGLGEFSGFWQFGYEVSGVYLWPSGNRYEGQWMSGKRHGLGVEKKGRWIYKGEWTQGFKGRYGVRVSERSGARFEGTWANGLQDGYGVETYGDGGTYFGQICQGLRSGYGVRRSVPYGVAARYKLKHFSDSLTSLRSCGATNSNTPLGIGEEGFRSAKERKNEENRGGFVLRDRCIPSAAEHCRPSQNERNASSGAGAATNPPKSSLRKTIMAKLRKQKSAGDAPEYSTSKKLNSFRSNASSASYESKHSSRTVPATAFDEDGRSTVDRLGDRSGGGSIEDEDAVAAALFGIITDPNVIESYMGEWKADKRTGFGIAERSDGLRYEGEWLNNKKNGYGITTHRDGVREEGKYKNNVLVSNRHRFGRILSLRLSKIHERAEFAATSAMSAAQSAQQKAEIAASRASNAKAKAQASEVSAKQARHESATARRRAEEIAPDFKQPGIVHSESAIPLDIDNQLEGGHVIVQNHIIQPPAMINNTPVQYGQAAAAALGQPTGALGFTINAAPIQLPTMVPPSQAAQFMGGADFPNMLQHSHFRYPIPTLQDWRPSSSYGFNVGMNPLDMMGTNHAAQTYNNRSSRFSAAPQNTRFQWQHRSTSQQSHPQSICQNLIFAQDKESFNRSAGYHCSPYPGEYFAAVGNDGMQDEDAKQHGFPSNFINNPSDGSSMRSSVMETHQPVQQQQQRTQTSQSVRNELRKAKLSSHPRHQIAGQKSVDEAAMMSKSVTKDDYCDPPFTNLRRRKSLPSIIHLANDLRDSCSVNRSKKSPVNLLLRSNRAGQLPKSKIAEESTFVIENGVRKRVREIKLSQKDEMQDKSRETNRQKRPSTITALFKSKEPSTHQQQHNNTNEQESKRKLSLHWSIVDDSPELPHTIVLEAVNANHRRSIPENIDTMHLTGLSRQEVCHLSSKRRQEIREEKKLRENPVLWLTVCTLNYLKRRKIVTLLIVLINVAFFIWLFLYWSQSLESSKTCSNGREDHSS